MSAGDRYVRPLRHEMEEVLKVPEHFRLIANSFGDELIYDWELPFKSGEGSGLCVRVCSSITPMQGGRDVGKDAIRVLLVNKKFDKIYDQAGRVYRTKNWREALKARVKEMFDKARDLDRCEHCNEFLPEGISKKNGKPYKYCVNPPCVAGTPHPFRRGKKL